MEPLQSSVQTFLDMARQPPELFQRPETWAAFLECITDLVHRCQGADPGERNRVLRELVAALGAVDPFQAGRIAVVCGTLVEQGGDPALASAALVQRLPEQLAATRAYVQRLAADLGIDPGQEGHEERLAQAVAERTNRVQLLQDLSLVILAAMAVLSRYPPGRQAARQNPALVEDAAGLAPVHREAYFLAKMLDLTDGEELLVLHPESKKGFRVAVDAVQNNFHLFTLLQDALVGPASEGKLDGPTGRAEVIATAKGEAPLNAGDTDSAVWTFYDWAGLRPDGTWSTFAAGHWILGEGKPGDIPLFEGKRVILLGPLGVPRSWNATFFGPLHEALRSRVQVVEALPVAAVEGWVARIRRAPRPSPANPG